MVINEKALIKDLQELIDERKNKSIVNDDDTFEVGYKTGYIVALSNLEKILEEYDF